MEKNRYPRLFRFKSQGETKTVLGGEHIQWHTRAKELEVTTSLNAQYDNPKESNNVGERVSIYFKLWTEKPIEAFALKGRLWTSGSKDITPVNMEKFFIYSLYLAR